MKIKIQSNLCYASTGKAREFVEKGRGGQLYFKTQTKLQLVNEITFKRKEQK